MFIFLKNLAYINAFLLKFSPKFCLPLSFSLSSSGTSALIILLIAHVLLHIICIDLATFLMGLWKRTLDVPYHMDLPEMAVFFHFFIRTSEAYHIELRPPTYLEQAEWVIIGCKPFTHASCLVTTARDERILFIRRLLKTIK